MAAEPSEKVMDTRLKEVTTAVILHEIGKKQDRKASSGSIQRRSVLTFCLSYNIAFTGFDAPRLKKLYIGRVITILLQTPNLCQ
jgi:type I restriction enzyme R subunit